MALEMARIRVFGMKSDLKNTMVTLRKLESVQIDEFSETTDIELESFEFKEEDRQKQRHLDELLSKVEGLQNALECESDIEPDNYNQDYFKEAESGVEELSAQVEELTERRETLAAEAASLPRYETTLEKLIPEIPDSARESKNQTVGIIVKRQNMDVLEVLRDRLTDITDNHAEITSRKIDEETQGMLVIFPRRYSDEVDHLLGEKDVARLRLPEEFEHNDPDSILVAIQKRIEAIPLELEELDDEQEHLKENWCLRLTRWAESIREDLQMFEMYARLAQTDATFVLMGWTPNKKLQELQKTLTDEVGEQVFVEELPIADEIKQKAPIILENPQAVRPFERLVHLLASPTYEGLDPTWLIAIFFPVIFGMILGDAGYGVVLLGICLLLMRRFKAGFVTDLIKILAYGSGWSIVFGILYGELFGTLGEELGMHPILFHRAGENVSSLLILSLGVGVAHITLGLILGVWTAIQEKSRSELLERGGMLVGLIALLVLTGVVAGFLPDGLMTTAIAGILVGVAILGSSMGWLGILIGPIEFISLIGNVLSYLRIAAIGLASVYLAKVANDLGGTLGSIIVGVLIAVLIHGLNIVLGAFSPSIHSLRLHYVEFFRKFYEGGGRRFEPYKSRFAQEGGK
ncbi:MAG: V-type ATPase 116kDa subunit family protein [Anaerolineales bacterium]|jgi:V/A-type H+-transporting ATPase subunit I